MTGIMKDMTEEILEDVIQNLTTGKFTDREIIEALAFGEQNPKVYHPLMKKYQPKYYCEGFGNPIQSFSLILDLNLNTKN